MLNILSSKSYKNTSIGWGSEASMKYLKCRLDIS